MVTRGDIEGEVAAPLPVRQVTDAEVVDFRQFIEGLVEDDDQAMQRRQIEALLRATTVAEVLEAGAVTKAADVLDDRLHVTAVRTSPSDYEEGSPFYLHLDVFNETKRKAQVISTGAVDVVLKCARLAQLGLIPFDVKIHRKDKATHDGFYPLFAEVVPPAFS
jgi:hypothetical protein